MSKDYRKPQADEAVPPVPPTTQTLDPQVFMTGVMAHAMMLAKMSASAIPKQSVEMAVSIVKELERFYNGQKEG